MITRAEIRALLAEVSVGHREDNYSRDWYCVEVGPEGREDGVVYDLAEKLREALTIALEAKQTPEMICKNCGHTKQYHRTADSGLRWCEWIHPATAERDWLGERCGMSCPGFEEIV